nr:unnamed protein product [Callosobruchus analis]
MNSKLQCIFKIRRKRIFVITARKYPRIIVRNHLYRYHVKALNKAGVEKTRWRCSYAEKLKCKASLYTYGKQVHIFRKHNHETPKVNVGDFQNETIHFCQGRKYPKLLIDSYQFQIHRREEKKTRWRCVNCNKTKCTARVFTFGRTVSVCGTHNHHPEIDPKAVLVPQLVRLIRKCNSMQD